MYGKRFEKELEMIVDALDNEQNKENFKRYMSSLVEDIAIKFSNSRNVKDKNVSKVSLIEAGWSHFDIALKKYKEAADLMQNRENEIFYFSTYFTWYVRQGIVEYLNSIGIKGQDLTD